MSTTEESTTTRRAAAVLFAAIVAAATMAGVSVRGVLTPGADAAALVARPVKLPSGTVTLTAPRGWTISVAASGLPRVRTLTLAPDGRIVATTLLNLSDNSKGTVEILDGFNESTGKFEKVTRYLGNLRNPHSVAFFKEGSDTWLYVALTDRLVRYPWRDGDTAPSGAAQDIVRLPDYGKPAKEGGWHLTRTVLPGPDRKIYLTVGSSCNACVEKEKERASVLRMDPDGSNVEVYATGLRNAVGMDIVNGKIYVTDMGADHLGNDQPADRVFELRKGAYYGWPTCYVNNGKQTVDPTYGKPGDCDNAVAPVSWFKAHSSPLGITQFGAEHSSPLLKNSTLVALHGSSNTSLRAGYAVVRLSPGGKHETVIGGFLPSSRKALARPCAMLAFGSERFLLTDDKGGNILLVNARGGL
jgi:glucose/arabinose dehydrogenase